jgi:redox-sensing transcriptional repressor
MAQFEHLARERRIAIGIITVPADRAQQIAETMVRSGLQAIWNFAPITLDVPEEIIVENVELYASLAIFSRKLEERRKAKAAAAQFAV